MASPLLQQILRFGAVGAVGFLVDGGLLWLLVASEVNPYLARALSFPTAVFVTWALNRSWTFREASEASRKGQLQRYISVQVVGTLTNYVLYSIVITVFGTAGVVIFWGFALGSLCAAIINFLGARLFAFRPTDQ